MENDVIFRTTDGCPIKIGDRYHIVQEEGIAHWICDEGDAVPTCDTYGEFENARSVKINGKYSGNVSK